MLFPRNFFVFLFILWPIHIFNSSPLPPRFRTTSVYSHYCVNNSHLVLYLQCVYPSILGLYPQCCAYTSLWMKLPSPLFSSLSSFCTSSILFSNNLSKGLFIIPISLITHMRIYYSRLHTPFINPLSIKLT